jgi:hypothetical protein
VPIAHCWRRAINQEKGMGRPAARVHEAEAFGQVIPCFALEKVAEKRLRKHKINGIVRLRNDIKFVRFRLVIVGFTGIGREVKSESIIERSSALVQHFFVDIYANVLISE